MPYSLVIAFRTTGVIIGTLCICAALFLYEDEEGRLQSKLEDLWIRADDIQKYALSRHVALMKIFATYITSRTDEFFGSRIVSLQSIGVSACYGAALYSVSIALYEIKLNIGSPSVWFQELGSFAFCLVLGSVPRFLPNIKLIKIWVSVVLFFALYNLVIPFAEMSYVGWVTPDLHKIYTFPLVILSGFMLGVAMFVIFTAILRSVIRKVSSANSFMATLIFTLLTCMPTVLLYLLFRLFLWQMMYFQFKIGDKQTGIDWRGGVEVVALSTMLSAFYINIFTLLVTTVFIMLGLFMLLHRLIWPVVHRPLYTLQKLGIGRRTKLLGTLGIFLIGISLGKYSWLETLVDILRHD